MKPNGSTVGVLAALGISLTAAVALPLVNVFKSLQPSELMVVRGGTTAVLVAFIIWRRVEARREQNRHIEDEKERIPLEPLYMPSRRIFGFSILFSAATLALYAGIREWGASPVLVVLTTTPIVNIGTKLIRGQSVHGRVYACLAGLLLGVAVALNPWQASFDAWGLVLSVAATLLAGIGFEVLAGAKDVDPYNKSFWLAAVTMVVGFGATLYGGQLPFVQESWSIPHAFALLGFGATGGFLYYLANIVAFAKLKTEVASTLAMAETPAVIVGAWLMLGEKLAATQWLGVAIALGATALLSATEANNKREE